MATVLFLLSVATTIVIIISIIHIDKLHSQAMQRRYVHIICSHIKMIMTLQHELSSQMLFICYKQQLDKQQLEALKLAHLIRILGICRNFSKFRFRGSVGICNVLGGCSNLSSTCSTFCLKFQTLLYEITLLLRLSTSLNTSINE